MPSLTRSFLIVCFAGLAACSGSSSNAPVVGTPVDASTAGSLAVDVVYDGSIPVAKPVDMRSVPQCAKAHADPVLEQPVLVQDGKLANVVVWVKSGLEGWVFSTPKDTVVINQVGCIYEPRVSAAMVGQTVQFKNSDPEPHNVHGRPKVVDEWNFIMSRPGSTRDMTFSKPEIAVAIGCDVHPWMSGYLAILPNPYFAVTSAQGTAKLSNLPPGEYVVAAWHEKLGTREQKVSLPARGSVNLRFDFSDGK